MDNLRKAHANARKGKGWYKEVQEVDDNLEYYLTTLQEMLKNHTYKTSEYTVFYKKEHRKVRKIYKLPYFPDRIAQWAIIQIIEPYLIKTFISDTYSAIPGRGIHSALHKIQHILKNDLDGCKYCLKLDAKHYYQSINHDILKEKYRKLFKDVDLLWILDEITDSINTAEDDDLISIYLLDEDIDEETGIPIGNYLSQYSGNYYFSDFDHWIKEVKHVKHYFRYMDDIVILGNSKVELFTLLKEISNYFTKYLNLLVKNNYQVFPTYIRGIDFLGYRVFQEYTLLRKTTCKDMKKKMLRIKVKANAKKLINYSEWCSINSYIGWLIHCDGFRLFKKFILPLLSNCDLYYNKVIKGGLITL